MNLFRAFATVGGLTMASRVLGLAREIILVALLGASAAAEAFFVAFRFPNLFRRFFAEGAFNMAFVPLFAKRLEGEGPDAARRFAEEIVSGLLSVLFVFTLAAQIAMPWLIYAIAAGFADDPEKLSLAILFSQIQFPYLLLMSLTAAISGVLNSLNKFAAAAAAPIFLNLTMIAAMTAAWALEASVGHWLSWSVLVAGVLQLALVYGAAARAGMRLRLRRPRWSADTKRLLVLGAPAALAGGVTQVNILIGTTIATFFDGAVVWLTLADRIYQLPLGVVGIAIGVALLPALSRQIRAEDAAAARRTMNQATVFAMALTAPAAAALMVIPEEIANLLFGRGAYTPADVAATGLAVGVFATGLPAYVLIKTLSPAYFANENTRSPLRFAVVSMAVNTALSVGLAPYLSWTAIPLATAAAAWVNVALLAANLSSQGDYRIDRATFRRLAGIVVASAAMVAALVPAADYFAAELSEPTLKYPSCLALVFGGAAVYALAAFMVGALRRADLRAAFRR